MQLEKRKASEEIDEGKSTKNPKNESTGTEHGKRLVAMMEHQQELISSSSSDTQKKRLSPEEGNERISSILKQSWEQGKGDSTVKRAEKYINDIKGILKYMGDNDNPWKNVESYTRDNIKCAILKNVIEQSWEQGKGDSTVKRIEKCTNDTKYTLKYMGDNDNPWKNDEHNINNAIKIAILENVVKQSWEQGKEDNTVKRAEECINDIKGILKYMGDNDNPWKNVKSSISDSAKDTILKNVVKQSWEQGKEDSTVKRAEECINDVKCILKYMGDNDNPWKNVKSYTSDNAKWAILKNVVKQSWEQGKEDNTVKRAEECINDVKCILKYMGDNDNPWKNVVEDPKIYNVKDTILKNVVKQSWRKEGKGKTFAERFEIGQKAAEFAKHQMDYSMLDNARAVGTIRDTLRVEERAMEENIEKWKKEGLPGRGWSQEDYRDKQVQDRLSANDRTIAHRISGKWTDYKEIHKICWSYGARASLDINASDLTDSKYQRMYDHLSKLEVAENELRQKVMEMSAFHYYKIRETKVDHGKVLDSFREVWIGPALKEYNTALREANEAGQHILAEEAKKADKHIFQGEGPA